MRGSTSSSAQRRPRGDGLCGACATSPSRPSTGGTSNFPLMTRLSSPSSRTTGSCCRGHGSAVERSVRSAAADAGIELTGVNVVSSGRVAQSIAASRSIVAITVEPPSFGLRSAALVSHGKPQTVALYASWDGHHPGSRVIEKCVVSLERWLSSRRPWVGDGPAGESTSGTGLPNE
jgi:hypothetical protein